MCSATTFFSQSDIEELKENSKYHNYYLSLITNNHNEWCGKISVSETLEYKKEGYKSFYNSTGNKIRQKFIESVKEDDIKVYDCSIYIEALDTDEDYSKLVDKIIANKVQPKVFVDNRNSFPKSDKQDWYNTYQDWDNWDYSDSVTNYDGLKAEIKSDSIVDEEIFSMFISGNNIAIPLNHLIQITEYDNTIMSPYHFLSYLELFWGTLNLQDKCEAIETVLDMFENYKTTFAKEIKQEYEKYATEVLGC